MSHSCQCHVKSEKPLPIRDQLVARALAILEATKEALIERDRSYNGNGIKFTDYQVEGVEDVVKSVLECVIRLHTSQDDDKAVDACGYMALMSAFIEAGCPQSRFSPIWKSYIPELQRIRQAKGNDVRLYYGRCGDAFNNDTKGE